MKIWDSLPVVVVVHFGSIDAFFFSKSGFTAGLFSSGTTVRLVTDSFSTLAIVKNKISRFSYSSFVRLIDCRFGLLFC